MAIQKFIINKSDLAALLRGEDLPILRPDGHIKGFCLEIEDDFTNGDAIKAMFPYGSYGTNGEFVHVFGVGGNGILVFKRDWWGAPYKESEDGERIHEAIKALEQESRKGHWEYIKDNFGTHRIRCSCCKYTEPEYITFTRNYCPNCGKPMEIEE